MVLPRAALGRGKHYLQGEWHFLVLGWKQTRLEKHHSIRWGMCRVQGLNNKNVWAFQALQRNKLGIIGACAVVVPGAKLLAA